VSDLPSGWEWVRLGDLGDEVRGSVRPQPGTTYELYSVPCFPTGKPEFLSGEEIGSSKRPVKPGDVLLCKINPRINRVWIVAEPAGVGPQIASTEYLVFRTPEPRLSAYLRWYLQGPAFRRWIELSVEGATGSHTRAKSGPILEQRIPLPPLAEQDRIVAAMEANLSSLEDAEASLEAARERLRLLGRALVDTMVDGERVALGELLCEPLRNGVSAKAAEQGPVRVATLTSVTRSQFVDEHTKLIDPGSRSVEDLWMRPGDVFVQRSNTPELVGSAALYRGEERWAIFPDLLIRVRVDPSRVEPAYLEAVLQSTKLRRYFQQAAQGVAGSMPKISQPVVEAAPIELPPLDVQRSKLRRLSEYRAVLRGVKDEVAQSSRRTASLRRSVLSAAFSGQLVPQDFDDEPASALLERIRAERPAAPTWRTRS
jgi:type I restriction enzyme S subunit